MFKQIAVALVMMTGLIQASAPTPQKGKEIRNQWFGLSSVDDYNNFKRNAGVHFTKVKVVNWVSVSRDGKTLAHIIVEKPESDVALQLFELLIADGADLTLADANGNTVETIIQSPDKNAFLAIAQKKTKVDDVAASNASAKAPEVIDPSQSNGKDGNADKAAGNADKSNDQSVATSSYFSGKYLASYAVALGVLGYFGFKYMNKQKQEPVAKK